VGVQAQREPLGAPVEILLGLAYRVSIRAKRQLRASRHRAAEQ
jgi:hypothetical protein